MKKILLPAFFLVLAACNDQKASETKATDVVAPVAEAVVETAMPDYLNGIRYADWEIGKVENTKAVLDFYKAWDSNQMGNLASICADTLKLRIPGEVNEIDIPHAKIFESLGKNREMYTSTTNEIFSIVSLHSKSKNEDWVMVTLYSKWKETDGKESSLLYQDNWRMQDGKLKFLMSFYKKPTKQFLKNNESK